MTTPRPIGSPNGEHLDDAKRNYLLPGEEPASEGDDRLPHNSAIHGPLPHNGTPARDARTTSATPGYCSFPLGALPQPMRDYTDACASAIDCDQAYIGLPLLTIMAAAIGNTHRIRLKRSWTEPAILWGAIVGESGTAKSPALDHAREFPRRRQGQAMTRFAAALAEYQEDHVRYERDVAAWKHAKCGSEPPAKPEPPVCERCLVDDATIEAVAPILLDNWRGALVMRDELAGWLGAFDRYAKKGGGEASKWIEMHGGRTVIIDRKTGTPRTIYIPRATVSICGGIQPGILRRLIGQEHRDSGLLARLLMAWPPRRPRRWTASEPADSLAARVEHAYDRLWELAPKAGKDGEPMPVLVDLAPTAKSLFVEFVNAHGAEQYELEGDLAAAWSKLEGYAARLALVHHLVRHADDPTAVGDSVDHDSMAAGIALVQWFAKEDRRIYAALEESQLDSEKRELADLVRRRGGTITARELQQARRRYPTAETADDALDALVKAGIGTWQNCAPSTRGGRPTRTFRIV